VPRTANDKYGTTIYDRKRAFNGYNFYVPKGQGAATLVDMQGELVHRWSSDEGQPDAALKPLVLPWMLGWFTAQMTSKGDVLAIVGEGFVLRLAWNSKLLWKTALSAHHDIQEADSGDIYVLTEDIRQVDSGGHKRTILDNGIAILSADGEIKQRISLYDALVRTPELASGLQEDMDKRFRPLEEKGIEKNIPPSVGEPSTDGGSPDWAAVQQMQWAERRRAVPGAMEQLAALLRTGKSSPDQRADIALLFAVPQAVSDVIHANAVLPLKRHKNGLWKDGDILVSLRHASTVAVLDIQQNRFIWSWGRDTIQGQHQPSITPDGNLLIYDNGMMRRQTRLIEVDPTTKTIVWTYSANPPSSFFSMVQGGCLLLPNGNVLAADSQAGRAFEITRGGEIVWEYFVPGHEDAGATRSTLYRMDRYSPELVDPLKRQR
jgi:hypothetical protein